MDNLFPAPCLDLEVHETADGGYITSTSGTHEVEPFVLEFLKHCDGISTVTDIGAQFAVDFGPLFGPALAQRAGWITAGIDAVTMSLGSRKAPVVKWTGSAETFEPLHATVEIIETCNFTCRHCYYASSPSKKGMLDTARCKDLFETLRSHGVSVIEITGGECTIHPDFSEILMAAAITFDLVAVISNGFLLGQDASLRAQVATHQNVIVQISLDGMRERHDKWRRRKGSFDSACVAIRELAALGVPVRVASSFTMDSVVDARDLFRAAKELGAAAIAFSPVAALGRGCNVSEPGSGAEELVNAIAAALSPFRGDPLLPEMHSPSATYHTASLHNCGAGSRTYAIDYNGDIRACNFSRDSKKFGNIFTQSYASLFDQDANVLFRQAPSPGGEECEQCDYRHYCKGCFVKAFMTSESVFPACPWRERWFPGMTLEAPAPSASDARRGVPVTIAPPRMRVETCSEHHSSP